MAESAGHSQAPAELEADMGEMQDDMESVTTAGTPKGRSLRAIMKQKGILRSPKRLAKRSQPDSPGPKSAVKSKRAELSPKQEKGKKVVKAKGTLKGGKGKKYCKGCGLYFDVELFDVNDPYCPNDRPAMKRLQRTAKAQRKGTLFKDVKADHSRLQNLLGYYREKSGDQGDAGGRLVPWSWAQFEEYEKSEQQTRRRVRGVMMHEERWIEYAGTVAGGRRNPIKAKQMWDEWLANKDHVRDFLGPDDQVQLYVRTDIELLEDDVYIKGKSVKRGDKMTKDASDEQLTKMRRRMQTGMEDAGEDDSRVNEDGVVGGVSGVARALMQGQDGFSGAGMHVGDFEELVAAAENPDEEDEKEEDCPTDEGSGGEGAGNQGGARGRAGGEVAGAPEKKRGWFDRDSKLAASCEKFTIMITGVENDLQHVSASLSEQLESPLVNHSLVAAWAAKGKVLQETLSHVLSKADGADDSLEKYIESFDDDSVTSPPKGLESASAGPSRKVGGGPPCAKFKLLTTISAWSSLLEEIYECNTADDLKQFSKDVPKPKAALVDLLNSAKKCLTELTRVVKAADKETRLAAAGKAAKAGSADRGACDGKTGDNAASVTGDMELLLGALPDSETKVVRIAVHKVEDLAARALDFTRPFIISGPAIAASMQGSKVLGAMQFHQSRFMKDPKIDTIKGGSGRGQQAPKSEILQGEILDTLSRAVGPDATELIFQGALGELFEKAGDLIPLAQVGSVKGAMAGSFFGMQRGLTFGGPEKNYLPALRLAISGSRQTAIILFDDLHDVIDATGAEKDAGGFFSIAQGKSYLQNATRQELGLLMRRIPVYVANIGPNEVAYAPAGAWFIERVGTADVFGMKASVLPKVPGSCRHLFDKLIAGYGEASAKELGVLRGSVHVIATACTQAAGVAAAEDAVAEEEPPVPTEVAPSEP